jgi:hypothetical protein
MSDETTPCPEHRRKINELLNDLADDEELQKIFKEGPGSKILRYMLGRGFTDDDFIAILKDNETYIGTTMAAKYWWLPDWHRADKHPQ